MNFKPKCFMSTVATAGTSERLTNSNLKVRSITITAERTNTGYVYVGDNQVSSTNYGMELLSGDSITITGAVPEEYISMKDIWLDVSVSGDGVSALYLEKIFTSA